MNLVIPIGGTGERFKRAGFSIPKPLIPVDGVPLIERVLRCYIMECDITFVLNESLKETQLPRILTSLGEKAPIYCPTTKGPVETILYAKDIIDNNQELLIADCDSLIEPNELLEALAIFRAMNATGGVTVRTTSDPNCSFAKIENGLVVETREKDPFTNISTTGPYWWKHGKDFVDVAKLAMEHGFYSVSPVYNFHKGRVVPFEVKTFRHLGTPEEWRDFTDGRGPQNI